MRATISGDGVHVESSFHNTKTIVVPSPLIVGGCQRREDKINNEIIVVVVVV